MEQSKRLSEKSRLWRGFRQVKSGAGYFQVQKPACAKEKGERLITVTFAVQL